MYAKKKTKKMVTMVIVLGEGQSKEFGYNKEWAAGNAYVYANTMHQNKLRRQKHENERAQNDVVHWFIDQIEQARNE